MRSTLLVTWFDLRESLRSRRAVALLIVYLLGSMAAAGLFIAILSEVESALAGSLSVAETDRPGAMTQALMESEQMVDIAAGLVGDRALGEELVSIPPIALFYGWLSLTFVPLLVAFTSADAISSELASGSVRFVLFRTDRLHWALGKLGGQTLLMTVGILGGALGVWVIGFFSLSSFAPAATALWLLALSMRASIYGFTFLGLTLGVSQVNRSSHGSRALALLVVIALGVGGMATGAEEIQRYAPVLIGSIHPLFPNAHRVDLWRPDLLERLPSVLMLLAMSAASFGAGHLVMSRRDA